MKSEGEKVIVHLQGQNGCMINFVGEINLGLEEESEILCDEDIEEMQYMCPMVKELKECIVNRIPVNEWPNCLKEFKRFADRFFVCMNVVYFIRKMKRENVMVPVMSLVGMIGLVKVE